MDTTEGRGTPLRIGVVVPVRVQRRFVVVEVQVRHVVGVVPRRLLFVFVLLAYGLCRGSLNIRVKDK